MTPEQIEKHAAQMRLNNSERRLEELTQSIKRRPPEYRRKRLREFWEQIRKDQRTAGHE